MRRPSHSRRFRDEAGFTLIELLAAMFVSMVVGFAVLDSLDNFSSHAAHQTRVTDANEQVRNTMDRVVSDVRQARTIEVAGPNDFVYTVTDSATQTRRERICLDGASRLWRSSVTTASPPTTPIAPGTACPIAGSGAVEIANRLSANSAANRIFRYDSAVPANVRSVGLTIALDASSVKKTATSTLRASAFVRAKSETAPPVTGDDITTSCGPNGPLLTLSASVGPLTVSYTGINGNALGTPGSAGTPIQLPPSSNLATVLATVTTAAGESTQLVKSLAC